MRSYSLKCYDPIKKNVPLCGLFLLSRGKNCGRPSFEPTANCLVLTCEPEHLYYFYWLTFGIWYTGRFRPVLVGSCVELIRIADARSVIDALNIRGHLIDPLLPAMVKGLQLQQKLAKQIDDLKYSYISLFGTFNRLEE